MSDPRLTERTYHEVLIETDAYAGNFERETAAFLFGAVSEEGVGAKYAALLSDDERAQMAWAHDPEEGGGALECHSDDGEGALFYASLTDTAEGLAADPPAYAQAVRLRFSRLISEQEFASVVQRAGLLVDALRTHAADYMLPSLPTRVTVRLERHQVTHEVLAEREVTP